jgi:hypothetical protein
MIPVTRLAAAKALLAAAWATVTYAKAQVRYSASPTPKHFASLQVAATKRASRIRFANSMQDQLRGKC